MSGVHLRQYQNSWYQPGRSMVWRALWMFLGQPLFRSIWFPSSNLRCRLLRLFGAQIGKRVVIRQGVIVKYPWHLIVGNDCWIGEQVWIDNLTTVRLGSDVCLSQGVYLCTGNHDWSDPAFGLRVSGIEIKDGGWAGAKSILMPGSGLGEAAICAAGSVVSGTISAYQIVAGNPASLVRTRMIREAEPPNSIVQEVAG
jgi:putative colanic acid biosynthesis acetyltransferase WcaF